MVMKRHNLGKKPYTWYDDEKKKVVDAVEVSKGVWVGGKIVDLDDDEKKLMAPAVDQTDLLKKQQAEIAKLKSQLEAAGSAKKEDKKEEKKEEEKKDEVKGPGSKPSQPASPPLAPPPGASNK